MNNLRIAVLSTGAMGSTFTKVFLNNGFTVTVWNRTLEKAKPLSELGAAIADTPTQAIEQSDVIFAIPNPYSALQDYLLTDEAKNALADKEVVIMSSCKSMDEPQATLDWLTSAKARMVEGKIFAFPSDIGLPHTQLAYCGNTTSFNRIKPLLDCLGQANYLGELITNAFVFESSLASWYLSTTGGLLNGLALCKAANLPLDTFVKTCMAATKNIESHMLTVVDKMIPSDNYKPEDFGTASIAGMAEVLEHFTQTFHHHHVEPTLVDSILPVMNQQTALGKGHLDMGSLIDLFNKTNR